MTFSMRDAVLDQMDREPVTEWMIYAEWQAQRERAEDEGTR